ELAPAALEEQDRTLHPLQEPVDLLGPSQPLYLQSPENGKIPVPQTVFPSGELALLVLTASFAIRESFQQEGFQIVPARKRGMILSVGLLAFLPAFRVRRQGLVDDGQGQDF